MEFNSNHGAPRCFGTETRSDRRRRRSRSRRGDAACGEPVACATQAEFHGWHFYWFHHHFHYSLRTRNGMLRGNRCRIFKSRVTDEHRMLQMLDPRVICFFAICCSHTLRIFSSQSSVSSLESRTIHDERAHVLSSSGFGRTDDQRVLHHYHYYRHRTNQRNYHGSIYSNNDTRHRRAVARECGRGNWVALRDTHAQHQQWLALVDFCGGCRILFLLRTVVSVVHCETRSSLDSHTNDH